jgi:hypothetical protein
MDMFHKIQELIDKNTMNIPEGDYLELCNTLQTLRRKVQPPSFLLDQNEPMTLPIFEPTITGSLVDEDDDDDDYHVSYADATLSEYVHQLHAEWSRTDSVVSQ